MGVPLVISLLLLACVGTSLVAGVAAIGWRRERARTRLLRERIIVDGQIAAMTAQTLAAMRHAVRQSNR